MDSRKPDRAQTTEDPELPSERTQRRLPPLASVKRARPPRSPGGSIGPGDGPARQRQRRTSDRPEPIVARDDAQELTGRDPETDRKGKRRKPEIPELAVEARAARRNLLVEGLEKRFHIVENQYHFKGDKGGLAFEVERHHLRTLHEDQGVVSAMIDMAEVRGWTTLKLGGTQAFRRAAWLEARGRGLETSGYSATKADLARLTDLRDERSQDRTRNTPVRDPKPAAPSRDPVSRQVDPAPVLDTTQRQAVRLLESIMTHRGDPPDAIARAVEMAAERLQAAGVFTGRLVETGTAPYRDDPAARDSFFVVLEDNGKTRQKIWGADLPRALSSSGATIGDEVALAFRGRRAVEVEVPVVDDRGRTTGSRKETVQRNNWELVPLDRLRADAKKRVALAAERSGRPGEVRVFDRNGLSQTTPSVRTPRPRGPERTL